MPYGRVKLPYPCTPVIPRQAEVTSGLGRKAVEKSHALVGLSFSGATRELARYLLMQLEYPLARRTFSKKWKTGINQDPQP